MKEEEFQSLVNLYSGTPPTPRESLTTARILEIRWEEAMNFFSPVFELFDRLHTSDIRLHGLSGGAPRQIPAGNTFRQLVSRNKLPPQYTVMLNERTTLAITVKIRTERRAQRLPKIHYLWSCQLAEIGSRETFEQIMTLPQLQNWVMRTIMEHRVPEGGETLITQMIEEVREVESPRAMSRVILVDPNPKD
jgi:hypothetical protein